MSQKTADITFANNVFHLTGEIGFSNVMSLFLKSLPHFDGASDLQFDFSEVKDSDSSGLALIIEWIRQGERRQQKVSFKSIPQGLLSIAKAARLENILVKQPT